MHNVKESDQASTQSPEDVAADERVEDRVAQLNATIFRCWSRRREASIEAGRAFIELKELLPHGKWERHVKETFSPQGISLRTAERWMERARKNDEKGKRRQLGAFELRQ